MKISDFAELNQVTTKMLRHYDSIGLLKPSTIDELTGYRSYDKNQSNLLNWIVIFKNLDFSLAEIKELLDKPTSKNSLVKELIQKRIDGSKIMNDQIQKKLQIDKLIQIIKKEGLQVNKSIDLMNIEEKSILEIKKNIPNMDLFLENVNVIIKGCNEDDIVTFIRTDLANFKKANDSYGYEVGDKVIVEFYKIIEKRLNKLEDVSTIGRAGGDEFIIFINGGIDKAKELSMKIVKDMEEFDFNSVGCEHQQGCYIGTLTSNVGLITEPRILIDTTIELLYNARDKGVNQIVSQ
ncbi:diguanylate cyclase [Mycoplasmatota bacterium WC44]